MNCEIIAVGTELLLGQIENTNAKFISQQLSQTGVNVFYHTVVGDNRDRLLSAIEIAESRADLIILTGGLGPTLDDITKEVLFEHLELTAYLNEEVFISIKEYFEKIGQEATQSQIKQAILPQNVTILKNTKGTAPGVILNEKEKTYILLPGPPSEMEPMFSQQVYPYLRDSQKEIIKSKVVKIFGIGEAEVEGKIKDILLQQTNPTIAPLANNGLVSLRITAKAESETEASELIKPIETKIRNILGSFIYGTDEDTMEAVVVKSLENGFLKVATAESCTGGLISKMLTDVPGASMVFERGLVTYSNDSKIQLLGINPKTIEKYGAVSEECAREMAEGLIKKFGVNIGLSVTGIAGPDAMGTDKKVGLVFIGLSMDCNGTRVFKFNFNGDRNIIRIKTALTALNIIRLAI